MRRIDRVRKFIARIVERYTILLGAIAIYGYYLVLALDLFERHEQKTGFLSIFLQFDSLLLMWGVIFVLVQLKKIRTERKRGEKKKNSLLHRFQRQQLQLATLDDISDMLNDRINNPLTMIALSANSLRQRTTHQGELATQVENIEGALKRVQEVMMGIQSYHTKKIVKLSRELMEEEEKVRAENESGA